MLGRGAQIQISTPTLNTVWNSTGVGTVLCWIPGLVTVQQARFQPAPVFPSGQVSLASE